MRDPQPGAEGPSTSTVSATRRINHSLLPLVSCVASIYILCGKSALISGVFLKRCDSPFRHAIFRRRGLRTMGKWYRKYREWTSIFWWRTLRKNAYILRPRYVYYTNTARPVTAKNSNNEVEILSLWLVEIRKFWTNNETANGESDERILVDISTRPRTREPSVRCVRTMRPRSIYARFRNKNFVTRMVWPGELAEKPRFHILQRGMKNMGEGHGGGIRSGSSIGLLRGGKIAWSATCGYFGVPYAGKRPVIFRNEISH